jgi:hypothetical protein
MPSTYSDNLQIELIATGEKTGTWGESTNVNLQVIDQSISGVADATLASAGTSSAPNTLAITQGSQSAGRNKFIEFKDGGDLGATAYVDLEPNTSSKIVFVRNSLSGDQSIVFFQGTYNVSRAYELINGKDAMLVFDGGGVTATVVNGLENLRIGSATTDGNTNVGGDLQVDGNVTTDGNTSTGGNSTVTGDVIVGGDVTVGGDSLDNLFTEIAGGLTDQYLAKNSDIDFDFKWVSGTEGVIDWGAISGTLSDQTDLQTELDILRGFSGEASSTPHRYWRLTVTGGDTPLGINALDFRRYGQAFKAGKRWDNGESANSLVETLTSSVSSTVSGIPISDLLNGTVTNPPSPATGERAIFASLPAFTVDFGSSPQAISSVRVAVDNDAITGLTLAYSDDNITFTDVGATTGISTQPSEEWSIDYPFLTQTEAQANDELTDFPNSGGSGLPDGGTVNQVLAKASSADQDVEWQTVSGGSDYWNFASTIETGDFNAVVGTYHFFSASGFSGSTVTLPATPSAGDRIGFAHAGFVTSAEKKLVVNVGARNYYGNNANFDIGFLGTLAGGGDFVTSVELYYADATIGWIELNRQTKVVPGS